MVKRVRKPLTQRERECRKVAREKALRKRLDACWWHLRMAVFVVLGLGVLSAGVWEFTSSGITRTVERGVNAVWQATADAGYAVSTVYIEGRHRTPLYDVKTAVNIDKGDPILALSIDELRGRLEQLPTVKTAEVQRVLPGRVIIRLSEREPVAVWQYNGQFALIDEEGAVMPDLNLKDHAHLPLVIGKGAPDHIKDVLKLLSSAPDLKDRLRAAIRVGNRRWNLRFAGGAEVKLPEKDAYDAWLHLATMHRKHGLLDRAVLTLDLRQKDRMTIRMAPSQVTSGSPTFARET